MTILQRFSTETLQESLQQTWPVLLLEQSRLLRRSSSHAVDAAAPLSTRAPAMCPPTSSTSRRTTLWATSSSVLVPGRWWRDDAGPSPVARPRRLPMPIPLQFYTESTTQFAHDGTFDVQYQVVFLEDGAH